MDIKNIFSEIQKQVSEEVFETIIQTQQFKIERIISRSHTTNDREWYDQDNNEWVIVLKGSAGLLFEGKKKVLVMGPGDYINIPSHQKHRVEWTAPEEETIWLAIHY